MGAFFREVGRDEPDLTGTMQAEGLRAHHRTGPGVANAAGVLQLIFNELNFRRKDSASFEKDRTVQADFL